MEKNNRAIVILLIMSIGLFIIGRVAFSSMKKSSEKDKAIHELLVQQGKYERLLDSTLCYIYNKYDEFLLDTYWESDIYYDLYDDMECWDRNDLRK